MVEMVNGQVVGQDVEVHGGLVGEVPVGAASPDDPDAAGSQDDEATTAAPAHVGVTQ